MTRTKSKKVLRRGKIVQNNHGVNIRRCCASCYNKGILPEGGRLCKLKNMIVEQREYCIQWELSLNYGKPLKGDGEVKNGRYLRYALNIRSKEDEAILNGLMLESERLTIEQIRSEYEEKFGSIFI